MPDRAERLLLLDSASLYYRAYFGVPDTITAPDGTPVNAVRGFLDMIARLVSQYRPTRLVACWDDDWRPAWRVEAIPTYKTHRVAGGDPVAGPVPEETPDTLAPQVPVIAETLAALGIARVGAPRCEADDVIGVLTTRASAGCAVDIVTGDRDLFQLVDDARPVRVLYTSRGIRNLQVVDQAELFARYGVSTGDGYADLAVLRGDTSDGIPGVAGIGEKTAAQLLDRFGTLAGVRAAVAQGSSQLTKAQRARLEVAADYLDVAPAVVRVLRDADLPEADDRAPRTPADMQHLGSLCEQWGLTTSVQRVLAALSEGA